MKLLIVGLSFSTPHSNLSWAQKFALGSYYQIPLASIPPLMYETMVHNYIAQLGILLFHMYFFKFSNS